MNRRAVLQSLAASSLGGFTAGCLGGDTDESGGTATGDPAPAERVEWASVGLRDAAFESLSEDDVRVAATVEIRNPTEYRVPVNELQYTVLWHRENSFEPFARGEVRGCGFVELLGANRTYLEFVREEGLPCPAEKTPTFVVEPGETTEISAVARPRTEAHRRVADGLLDASDPVYVRIDGEAMLWNQRVDVDFETETGLEPV